ncbi:MAG: hypothetical protein ACK4FJ_16985 [Ferrovibrio sp.]|uniref:hypothetical protein n=1 Tax=Ferrovibrio sp. TaxID=1917215 RepID=UPI0039198B0B
MIQNAFAWQSCPVDPKILPLVDAMNATGLIRTWASCQGHLTGTSCPYVAFFCDVPVAETLAENLWTLRRSSRLNFNWHIEGGFNYQHRLIYSLRSHELSHANGMAKVLWNYAVLRSRIDEDLKRLAEELLNGRILARNRPPPKKGQHSDDHCEEEDLVPARLEVFSAGRIRCFAFRASLFSIPGNEMLTRTAGDKHSGHTESPISGDRTIIPNPVSIREGTASC